MSLPAQGHALCLGHAVAGASEHLKHQAVAECSSESQLAAPPSYQESQRSVERRADQSDPSRTGGARAGGDVRQADMEEEARSIKDAVKLLMQVSAVDRVLSSSAAMYHIMYHPSLREPGVPCKP